MGTGDGRRARVVVVGSANMDLTGQVRRLPRAGETVIGRSFRTVPGGKGANQAVAAARLGADVALIGCVGDDVFGPDLRRGLENSGVDTRRVRTVSNRPSGVALIGVENEGGENSIMVFPGANSDLGPADLEAAAETIADADIVVCSLEVPLASVIAAGEIARQCGVPLILNPAPAQELPSEFLGRVSIATPNEHEVRILAGAPAAGPAEAAAALRQFGVHAVVVTLGPDGALADTGRDEPSIVAAYRAGVPLDTTAAGDCFTGALAVACAEGKGLLAAVGFANAAAAISVTRRGAQSSLPDRAEVDELMAKTAQGTRNLQLLRPVE